MTILQIIGFIIIFYFVHNIYIKFRKLHPKQLNGPTPLPVLGNLLIFGGLPHRDLTKLTSKFGKIFRLWFADYYTVVVSDPVLIREMFVDNAENFNDRPKTPLYQYGSDNLGTVTSSGEDWKMNRDIVGRAMRKTNLKQIYDVIDKQVEILIESMNEIEKTSQPFDQRYYINRFTMAAMFKYIFNEDIPIEKDDIYNSEISKLMKPLQQVFKDFTGGSLFDVLKIARPFYLYYLRHSGRDFFKIMDFIKIKYDQHLKTYNPDVQRDLLDILVKEYGTDSEKNVVSILATLGDFFLAGVDTSSTALEYMVMMMCNYPEIQEKAYQSIKSVINGNNNNKVLLSDRQAMPYIMAIIKETLRYKFVTAFGVTRTASNDIMIGGHFIPKDSTILINYHALSFNEEYYENPNEFNPSRFLKAESNLAWIPFSIGPRNCVGQNFALDEMFLCFSNMLLNFKFKSIDGKQLDEFESYGLTLRCKTPFKVLLEKRN